MKYIYDIDLLLSWYETYNQYDDANLKLMKVINTEYFFIKENNILLLK